MNLYRKMLVAYDGSDLSNKAYKEAIALAKEDISSEVEVILVINPTSNITSSSNYGIAEEEFEDATILMKHINEQLRRDLPNNVTNAAVLQGTPGEEIARYAIMNGIELIIMGSRGLGGIKELFLGSVSHSVLQLSSCPVLIIK
ncbi:universal stress protein [Metabacillus sp. RGM 3146]|uniref:universal stress protein n=1 Tax=Metabacillus sp. RGM 3146 TaxID=3401092 RepID=UPI003B9CF01D